MKFKSRLLTHFSGFWGYFSKHSSLPAHYNFWRGTLWK